MKFKLDENIPARIARVLSALGHDVHTTDEEGLTGAVDPEVWRAVRGEARFLITQDKDFCDARKFVPGENSGVLILRLHNPSRVTLARRIIEIVNTQPLESYLGATVVATKHGVRVHRNNQRK